MYLNDLVPPSPIDDYLPSSADRITNINNAGANELAPLLDVFILGPAMVYSGLGKDLPGPLRAMILLTGIGTIAKNLNRIYPSS